MLTLPLLKGLVFVTGIAVATATPHRTVSREEVLVDLSNDNPRLHVRDLTSLPDSTLPHLDNHFAQRAAHNPWLFGHLLARYGTAAVFRQVRETYERDHLRWGCDSRFPFLAFFLRLDATEGARILRSSLQERTANGCFRSMLWSVTRIFPAADIEAIAIDSLDDSDPEVAADAAMTLSRHGSVAAEQHLWDRLQRWAEQWRNRPTRELYGDPATGETAQYGHIRLGDSLRGAIIAAQAWYFDELRRRRLYATCWTEHCRMQFEAMPRPAIIRIRVHQLMYDVPRWEVGWYSPDTLDRFRAKLAQFPTGSAFGWCTEREGGGELAKAEMARWRRQAKQIVESQGRKFVERPPSGSCSTDARKP